MTGIRKRILLVEDEEKLVGVIKSFLESKGYLVIPAMDGKKALELFDRESFIMVILDLMLPEIAGEEVCRAIRKKSNVPIIMLTAKSDEADMLTGLGIGADDYITKPFSLKSLHARIEAVLRRAADDIMPILGIRSFNDGDLLVDFESHSITRKSSQGELEDIKLTPNEYKILTAFIRNSGKVLTRDELIAAAFGDEYEGYDRTIDSHIKNLRQKIEKDAKRPVYIKTIHGVGYKFGGE